MVGQTQLQSRIEQLIENRTFPRFSILVGPKGSGKKTFAKWVANQFQKNEIATYFMCPDIKVDTIRDIINGAYKIAGTNIYIIPDADNMSNAAKNALLKVTEEPPNNAYFIMTLEDENNTLETIRSRGTVFHMDRYTPDEILQFAEKDNGTHYVPEVRDIITGICDTPGDVITLYNSGIKEFYDYVQLVVDNIADVQLANSFKIPSKVALKDDTEGYDFTLFLKCMIIVCSDRMKQNVIYAEVVQCISRYLQRTRVKGINKTMLLDNLILDIRKLLK